MTLTDMLKQTTEDFNSLKSIIEADVPVTETLLSLVSRWYLNVEIVYPIPEMPLSTEERKLISTDALTEMSNIVRDAIQRLADGADEDDTVETISPKLDALWRELAGVYAPILNERFRRVIADNDPNDTKQALVEMIQMMAERTGEDVETVVEKMREDETVRAKLRTLGIDPDSI